jgi:hypothetical protein
VLLEVWLLLIQLTQAGQFVRVHQDLAAPAFSADKAPAVIYGCFFDFSAMAAKILINGHF